MSWEYFGHSFNAQCMYTNDDIFFVREVSVYYVSIDCDGYSYAPRIDLFNILRLMINGTEIDRVNKFNFLDLTINEFMTWTSHSANIANKIFRTIMNRLID